MEAIDSGLDPNIEDMEIDPLSVVEPTKVQSWSLELTSRCNLRCTYCSVPHAPEHAMPYFHRLPPKLLKQLSIKFPKKVVLYSTTK